MFLNKKIYISIHLLDVLDDPVLGEHQLLELVLEVIEETVLDEVDEAGEEVTDLQLDLEFHVGLDVRGDLDDNLFQTFALL